MEAARRRAIRVVFPFRRAAAGGDCVSVRSEAALGPAQKVRRLVSNLIQSPTKWLRARRISAWVPKCLHMQIPLFQIEHRHGTAFLLNFL